MRAADASADAQCNAGLIFVGHQECGQFGNPSKNLLDPEFQRSGDLISKFLATTS
jgi:hypothetical protein